MEPQARLDCFAWLSNRAPVKLTWTTHLSKAADEAAAEGRIQVLAFLAESAQPSYSSQTLGESQCAAAARAGQIAVLAWLHDHVDSSSWTSAVCRAAVQAGQMEALHWLACVRKPPCACDDIVLKEAARLGKLNFIQFLRSTQPPCPWSPDVCTAAVSHPDCLKWLRQQHPACPWGADSMKAAAETGDLDLMKWMRQGVHPCPWHEQCTAIAVKAGDLSLLKWMRKGPKPCPWDTQCTAIAVKAGNMTLLKWIRSQKHTCPFHWKCMNHAAARGDIPMLEWLAGQDPKRLKFDRADCLPSAAAHGQLEAMQWLRRLSPPAPWDSGHKNTLVAAVARGASNDQLVQWMLSQDPPCDWQQGVLQTYAAAGNLTMLQWLHTAGYHADVHAAVSAAQAGHVPVLAWILSMIKMSVEQRSMLRNWERLSMWEHRSSGSQPQERWPAPTLMLWADLLPGCKLNPQLHRQLQQARAAYCTLHGLVRWRRNQLLLSSSGSSSTSRASTSAAAACHGSTAAGQQLLTNLAKLPNELVIRIAVAAHLQHDQPI